MCVFTYLIFISDRWVECFNVTSTWIRCVIFLIKKTQGCTSDGIYVLIFTRMPGEGNRRRLGSLLLCLFDIILVLINSLFVVSLKSKAWLNKKRELEDLACVHRRGKTCFCCAPRKGNEVQLKLRTLTKNCTHLINSEISNVYCNATSTNVAKTERKTIIIAKI